MGSLDTSIQRV